MPASRPRTVVQDVRAVLREPMLALLLVAVIVNFLLAELLDGAIPRASPLGLGKQLFRGHVSMEKLDLN